MNHETTHDAAPQPFEFAAGRLASLIAGGAAPERVVEAVGTMVAAWSEEPDMSVDVLHTRIGELWDRFSAEAAELQAQLSDAEAGDQASAGLGQRVLAGLNAAVGVFEAVQR